MSRIIQTANSTYANIDASERIQHIIASLGPEKKLIQSTSFGLQSVVLLHMISSIKPEVPVVFVNTGYLFEETLEYASMLTSLLKLNVIHVQPKMSPNQIESEFGQMWLQGKQQLGEFNNLTKLEPLKQLFKSLQPQIWLSGVRRQQSKQRQTLPYAVERFNCTKMHPLLDWTDKMVHDYIESNDLPRHPLDGKGYLSVGDTVTTKSVYEVDDPSETRFMGLKRECGLHA